MNDRITLKEIKEGICKLVLNYQVNYDIEKLDKIANMWLGFFKNEKAEWYFEAVDRCIENLILYQHRLPTVAEVREYFDPYRRYQKL
jgi:hypothetical protein